jgi:hypothetical protein
MPRPAPANTRPDAATDTGGEDKHMVGSRPIDIARVIQEVLDAPVQVMSEERVLLEQATVLRRCIRGKAPWLRTAAAELPEGDTRRVEAEDAAREALFRVRALKPGNGLQSLTVYVRSLAQAAKRVTDNETRLRMIDETADGGHVVTDAAEPPRTDGPSSPDGSEQPPRSV